MKTIEEKLTASRAFLDTVCKPTYTIKHGIIARKANTTYSIQVRRKDSFADYFVIPHVGPAESEIVEIFHHLLGLSERDAVAKEREIAEEYLSRLKAERARNTALVAALEEIKKPWYVFKLGKRASLKSTLEQYKTRCMAIHEIASRALTANTEKGGSNG